MPARIFPQFEAFLQMAGYLPIALKKLVYVYAAFLSGKNSLNFDSGSSCSTVLTLGGLVRDPGVMASTRELSKVQEVDSRRALISAGKGSWEELPHKVPEQLIEVLLLTTPDSAKNPVASQNF